MPSMPQLTYITELWSSKYIIEKFNYKGSSSKYFRPKGSEEKKKKVKNKVCTYIKKNTYIKQKLSIISWWFT